MTKCDCQRESDGCSVHDCSLRFQLCAALRRELLTLKLHFCPSYVAIFAVTMYMVFVASSRMTRYGHTSLIDYWPRNYTVPISVAMIEVNNADGDIEKVSLEELLASVARNHKIDNELITIERQDHLDTCDGCLDSLRLSDVGFRLTHDWSKMISLPVELCMLLIGIYMLAFTLTPLFQATPTVNVASIAIRALRIPTPLIVLRPILYAATSLPGPSWECQTKHVRGFSSEDATCEYMTLSGYMMFATLMIFLIVKYVLRMPFSTMGKLSWIAFAVTLFCCQLYLVLVFRLSYSVDIISSIVLVIAVGSVDFVLFPKDLKSVDDHSEDCIFELPDVSAKSRYGLS